MVSDRLLLVSCVDGSSGTEVHGQHATFDKGSLASAVRANGGQRASVLELGLGFLPEVGDPTEIGFGRRDGWVDEEPDGKDRGKEECRWDPPPPGYG
jgi:hypothetical protein